MTFAIVRTTPTAKMTTAGLLCDLDADSTMANVFQAMLSASTPPTDAELDELRIAMWGSLEEPRRDLIEHAHWERTTQRQKDMMRAFLAALGAKHE